MTPSHSKSEMTDLHKVGIRLRYVEHNGATTTTVGELLELATTVKHFRSALDRTGLHLGHAIAVKNGKVLYPIRQQTAADGAVHQHKSPQETIRDLVSTANLAGNKPPITPEATNSASSSPVQNKLAKPEDTCQLRREHIDIERGPRYIYIDDEKIPFSGGLDSPPENAPAETMAAIQITGRERHYIDAQGNRFRSEYGGDDGVITGETDTTLHVVRIEKVLLSEPEQLALPLNAQKLLED